MLTNTPSPQKTRISKNLLTYLLLSLVIILLGTTGYFYYQYQKLFKSPIAAQITAQEEAQRLAADIGKLMLLPNDETPTVATVTDVDKLKDQLFFKNAKNGSKVLIYPNSKLAVIYDPKANLIINIGPINFAQQQAQQIQKTHVGLRNGTNISGLTFKVEADIQKSFPDVGVVMKDQDKRTDYEKTLVVVLNETAKNVATELAKALNAQMGKLPDGETKPEGVDILIIVGKDKG